MVRLNPNVADLLTNGCEYIWDLALSTRLVKSAEVVLVNERDVR
jgi:hypothetical protein